MSKSLEAIVAYDENRVIGFEGDMPWRGQLPADLAHFRQLTIGHTILMGRRTFDSIGKPLGDRRNVVVTHQADLIVEGAEVAHGVDEALEAVSGDHRVFVIGGAQLYEATLPFISTVHATVIHHAFEGDTYFPDLDPASWGEFRTEHHSPDDRNTYGYSFITHQRGVNNKYVYLPHGQRTPEQAREYERIDQLGICPFCPEHLDDWHSAETLVENDRWLLTPLDYPYRNTDIHLMAIPRFHAEKLRDLEPDDFAKLLKLFQWAESTFEIDSGGIVMRFGNPAHNGASVMHLHVHFVVPKHNLSKEQKVRFKIS